MKTSRLLQRFVLIAALVVVVAVVAISVVARNGAALGNIAAPDTDDVTPSVVANAALNGAWYGNLAITRYDQQAGQPSAHLTQAFYLKLALRADNTIVGAYATCSTDKSTPSRSAQEYDIAHGEMDKALIYLDIFTDIFTTMHGPVSGQSMSLTGMRYVPHSDAISDKYASNLHKVSSSAYLSACSIASN